jgi:uncharacterized protein YbbC (DUF1343 family)
MRTGLDVLRDQEWAPLRGLRVGLVCHPASVDGELRHAADLLAGAAGVRLAALFGPEHGFYGQAQDLIGVTGDRDAPSGLRVHSLYGDTFDSLRPTEEQLRGLDALVIDLQDVGSRYYTFQATMLFCLEAASGRDLKVFVLDRPNPLGGEAVEGPTLRPGFESFVGIHPLPTRHGLTIGELARLYRAERGLAVDLEVIPCDGWRRELDFERTGLPWVMPSPNMPTVETAFVYPGQCLIEGTNLSEGRGTTRPFEWVGAPYLDAHRFAAALEAATLPGVRFRPARFTPTFHKWAGRLCGGVQVHVTDVDRFEPFVTYLTVIATARRLSRRGFAWRRPPYEFEHRRLPIDILCGTDVIRRAIERGRPVGEIARGWQPALSAWRRRRARYLAYA